MDAGSIAQIFDDAGGNPYHILQAFYTELREKLLVTNKETNNDPEIHYSAVPTETGNGVESFEVGLSYENGEIQDVFIEGCIDGRAAQIEIYGSDYHAESALNYIDFGDLLRECTEALEYQVTMLQSCREEPRPGNGS